MGTGRDSYIVRDNSRLEGAQERGHAKQFMGGLRDQAERHGHHNGRHERWYYTAISSGTLRPRDRSPTSPTQLQSLKFSRSSSMPNIGRWDIGPADENAPRREAWAEPSDAGEKALQRMLRRAVVSLRRRSKPPESIFLGGGAAWAEAQG